LVLQSVAVVCWCTRLIMIHICAWLNSLRFIWVCVVVCGCVFVYTRTHTHKDIKAIYYQHSLHPSFVCMHACIHTCMHACMHAHMYICTYVRKQASKQACIYAAYKDACSAPPPPRPPNTHTPGQKQGVRKPQLTPLPHPVATDPLAPTPLPPVPPAQEPAHNTHTTHSSAPSCRN